MNTVFKIKIRRTKKLHNLNQRNQQRNILKQFLRVFMKEKGVIIQMAMVLYILQIKMVRPDSLIVFQKEFIHRVKSIEKYLLLITIITTLLIKPSGRKIVMIVVVIP